MLVGELLELLQNPDRIRVKAETGEEIFIGWRADAIEKEFTSRKIKGYKVALEIRHNEWEKRNLLRPLQPEETPDYKFSDMQVKLYHEIYI